MLVVKDDVVEYSELSPTFLRWKVDILSGKNKVQVCKGQNAGSLHSSNKGKRYYYMTQYKGKKELNHRIIYMLFHGGIPEGYVVDHIDGNELNNSITNLRAIPVRHNCHNRFILDRNSTGITGVSFKFQHGKTGVVAFWNEVDGKRRSKYFSITIYGLMPAFAMACAYRQQILLNLNKEGMAYTERHGK